MKKGSRDVLKARSAARVTAFVQQAGEIIQSAMLRGGLSAEAAAEAAREAVHDICAVYGGTWMYVPRDLPFELGKRDLEIYEQFNGANVQDLVLKYHLSHVRIYQIVARVKAEQLRKRQPSLPFDES